MKPETLRKKLVEALEDDRVIDAPALLDEFSEDLTENPPRHPQVAVQPTTVEEIRAIVKLAGEAKVPLTPRVAGTNVGGIAIPAEGGIVLDLRWMDKILEVNEVDQYAVIEPGVTWETLKAHLEQRGSDLTIGYPLSPPDTSVLCNCILDGLGNLSLRQGSMGRWLNGVEAVMADGSVVTTGSRAMSDLWFSTAPLPDLTSLFVNFQGTTGIVTKAAIQLWPKPAFRYRGFILSYDRRATFEAMRGLSRMNILSDLGGLSWPSGRMLFHPERPTERDPSEPEFFLYLDVGGVTEKHLALKLEIITDFLAELRERGLDLEEPMEMSELVRIEPAFSAMADFPTRLSFLLDYPGGGMTWIGTYGPMSRFEQCADEALQVMDRYGMPPMVVSRPMLGGHFGVLRYLSVFDKRDPKEVELIRKMHADIADVVVDNGFIVYKTPEWAVKRFHDRIDPGFLKLFRKIRGVLDPDGIFSPNNLPY